MKISVTIDSSAWNFLFNNSIDINVALPPDEFSVFITREVEIEISAIPNQGIDGTDKEPLKQYIRDSIRRNNVITTATFGFAEASPANGPAIYAGFGQGAFQSDSDRSWYSSEQIKKQIIGKSKKKSGLTKNIADASVGAASFHGLVLTCDTNKGPIKTASKSGGTVIFLSEPLNAESLKQVLRESAQQGIQPDA